MFVPMGKHVQSLFTNDDLEIAASRLRKNTAAALFLWENLWTDNLRKALTASGGTLVARARNSRRSRQADQQAARGRRTQGRSGEEAQGRG